MSGRRTSRWLAVAALAGSAAFVIGRGLLEERTGPAAPVAPTSAPLTPPSSAKALSNPPPASAPPLPAARAAPGEPPRALAPPDPLPPVPMPAPLSRETDAGEPAAVRVENGLLTVQVQGRPLRWVLDEISRKSGVSIIGAEGLGRQRVSITLRDLPLVEGLQQILARFDAFFFMGGGPARGSLRAVWVYPAGMGQDIVPVPPEAWASTFDLERGMSDPDPGARAQTVETLVERKGQQALDAVIEALRDPDDHVRNRALDVALNSGIALPEGTLRGLARYDPSPRVRLLALGAIASGIEPTSAAEMNIQALAAAYLHDPNPALRAQARQVIEELDTPAARVPVQGQDGLQAP